MAGRFKIEAIFKAVDHMSAPVSKMQNRIQKFTRGMTRNFRRINRQIGRIVSGLRRGAGRIARFGGVILAAMGAATVIAIKRVADGADALAKQARRLDFPIKDLQKWIFVGEQSGVTSEAMSKSIDILTKRLGEAKGGTGEMVSGMKILNPQLLRQILATDNVNDAMLIGIEGMRNAKSATEKAAIANLLFGRSGLSMVNISKLTEKQFAATGREAEGFGFITNKLAKNAEDFNDESNSMKRTLGSLLQQAILPILPAITKYIKTFREFLVANKVKILENVKDILISLRDKFFALGDAIKTLATDDDFVENFKAGIDTMAKFGSFLFNNAGMILKLVGILIAVSIALKAFAIVMAIVNLVMLLNPVGLVIAGIVALIAIAALLILAFDPVKEFFINLWEGILNAFLLMIEGIKKAIGFVKGIGKFFGFGGEEKSDEDRAREIFGPGPLPVAQVGIGKMFGSGDEEEEQGSPASAASKSQLITPGESAARSMEERQTTTTAEVTIRDETGRAEVTGGQLGAGLILQQSGAF